MIDGQAPTAYTHESHKGTSWDMLTWDPQVFKDTIRTLHDTGMQISVHCGGDAALDLTLDAYEAALNANPRSDHRHSIEHAVISTKDATQRIKDLGVVIQSNPTFIRMSGDYYEQVFTKKQMDRVIVDREWLDAGIPLAYGSDDPTTPWYKPQITIAAGMARMTLSGKVINREQALTFQEALRACTMGAAYVAHEENIKGSIEIGKLADITIWSQDPTGATPKELFDLPDIFMTINGGKIVHQAQILLFKGRWMYKVTSVEVGHPLLGLPRRPHRCPIRYSLNLKYAQAYKGLCHGCRKAPWRIPYCLPGNKFA